MLLKLNMYRFPIWVLNAVRGYGRERTTSSLSKLKSKKANRFSFEVKHGIVAEGNIGSRRMILSQRYRTAERLTGWL